MRIKSGVWHWLAAGCGLTGLLVGMGIEGGAQLGGVITDGEVCTATLAGGSGGVYAAGLCRAGPGAAADGEDPPAAGEHRAAQQEGRLMGKYRVHIECSKTLPEKNSQYVQCLSYVVGAPPRALPGKGRGDGKAALCGVRQLYAVPYGKAEMRKECRHGKQH